jgi:membrane fusion protein, multidrug efflux system
MIAKFRSVAIAGTLLIALYQSALAQGGPPPAPAVTVAAPLSKRITQWDEYWGRFKAVENVEVRARVSGFIETVHFKDGSMIKAGDLLFTLDKRPFELAVDNAKAEVARIEAQVALAENEVDRAEPLARSKVLSDRDFDQRKSSLRAAQAQVLAAKANLKSAELNLEWAEVRAPISGRISDRKIDPGNLITGGATGATLLTSIVSLQPIHFEFDVSENDYLRYRRLLMAGQRPSSRDTQNPVRAKLADEEDWIHQGKMDFVDNTFNERSGTLRGRAIFENEESTLTPGVFARLQLFGGPCSYQMLQLYLIKPAKSFYPSMQKTKLFLFR